MRYNIPYTMEDISTEKQTLSLSQLNGRIKAAITDTLPDMYWVTAEIAEIKLNQRGHCYLELVEKEDDSTIAQIKATIWAYEYRSISSKFQKETNEPLSRGMKILLLAAVTFHEVYGLSLNIRNIDPTYTIGEMARKKKEVIERLRKEGIIDKNKSLELPLVPQHIAVISSPTAAGYGDFINHLYANPYGYRFVHVLFPALMQGNEAERSVIRALDQIRKKRLDFDLAVIIRGGGSTIDLSCFDSYALSSAVAAFPLPIISGIGHEKDDTVVDIVSHTRMKTPTAVAEFIISGVRSFEETVLGLETRIVNRVEEMLKDEKHILNSLARQLSLVPYRLKSVHLNRLLLLQKDIRGHLRQIFHANKSRLEAVRQAVRHLDPEQVLRRGYSITRYKGKVVKDASTLKSGVMIETTLHKGTVASIVHSEKAGKEGKDHGKKQGTDLLPGLE
ncbi:MAG TPA: exodeoxyribonuclease VII large subunit [Thermodesulfovibrionales bacterium]|nr:exodeoxyribonuclease VII large subunit [Thermodesulfovibrionales bacterium]